MDLRLAVGFIFVWINLSSTAPSALGADAGTSGKVRSAPGIEQHHPKDWRFSMPKGEPIKGRAVFEKFECYDCHEVRGESFPYPSSEAGPELSQMGSLHPLEFFTESIINPSAVAGKKDRTPNGKSRMSEDHIEKMSLRELIDLPSYIASRKPPMTANFVKGIGKIVALVPEAQEIVIDHGTIKDFMDAMTMGYKVSSAAVLKGLRSGDRVEFTLDTAQRVITKIDKLQK